MATATLFKWHHFQPEIILLCVRLYCRYALSYRDMEEMMREQRIEVNHTTIYRWVQDYAPELEKRCHLYLRLTSDSWRMDETYIRVTRRIEIFLRGISVSCG